MPKRETVEDVAKRETEEIRDRERQKAEALEGQKRIAAAIPPRFFEFAKELREVVRRFNAASLPEHRMEWRESAALAAGDASNLNADFNLSFWRKKVRINIRLMSMGRPGKPDVYLIDGDGNIKDENFSLRVEGSWREGKLLYRISVNYKRLENVAMDDLADWLVLSAVKEELIF